MYILYCTVTVRANTYVCVRVYVCVCMCVCLRCVEETVALVTHSHRLLTPLHHHLPAGAGVTHQAATAPAVMSPVKLTERERENSNSYV